MVKEIEKDPKNAAKEELLKIIAAYKIANPVKAAAKEEEFKKKLAAL